MSLQLVVNNDTVEPSIFNNPGCNIEEANYAVIGVHPVLGHGVIYWARNEFDAYRLRKVVRDTEGQAKIYYTPGGHTDEQTKMMISQMWQLGAEMDFNDVWDK